MQLCDHGCSPVCLHCAHFDASTVMEEGEGYCRKNSKMYDAADYCDDFRCLNVKEEIECQQES